MSTLTVSGTVAYYYVGPGSYLTITGTGAVLAAHGADGGSGNPPGDGSDADAAVAGSESALANGGEISGGAGGYGGSGGRGEGADGQGFTGGRGGNGGSGAAFTEATATNAGRIAGGSGGDGGVGGDAYFGGYGGDGGIGGLGFNLAGGSLANYGLIAGGAGGEGGQGGRGHAHQAYGGFGGMGGAGVALSNTGSCTNGGTIFGGSGGDGGSIGIGGINGYGGAGGVGLLLSGVAGCTNRGTIEGGPGGAGGAVGGYGTGGLGGAGGAGLILARGDVTNTGLILGGDGGVSPFFGTLKAPPGDGAVVTGGSLSNAGTIASGAGGGASGALLTGGTIINMASGTITAASGGFGVYLRSGYLANRGCIESGYGGGATSIGVVLNSAQATAVNRGTIQGGTYGVEGDGDLQNEGVIVGGVFLGNSTVVNSGTISGLYGVRDGYGHSSVTNDGVIEGTTDSILFVSSTDRLTVESGAAFAGMIVGGGGTLDLSGGAGTITGLGGAGVLSGAASGTFSGFGTYGIDGGGAWTVATSGTLASGRSLTVSLGSFLTVESGATVALDQSKVTNSGQIELAAKGTIAGYGGAVLSNSGTIAGGGVLLGSFEITNRAGGVVDDDVGTMIINGNGVQIGLVNDGVVETTGTGDLGLKAIRISGTGTIVDGVEVKLEGAVIDDGSLAVERGAILLTTAPGDTISASVTVTNAGDIDGAVGGLTIESSVANSGLLQADKADLTIEGAITGSGQLRVVGDGVLTVAGATSETMQFDAGATGTLVAGTGYAGRIVGFSASGANRIDLANIVANGWKFGGTTTSGNLTLYDGATKVDTIRLYGDFLDSTFNLTSDGAGGTLLTDPSRIAQAMAGLGPSGGSSANGLIPAAALMTTLVSPLG